MKQEEKTKRTREKILRAAVAEFGTKSYENASLNAICSDNQITKGLIYHNFENKDDLYLRCVELCFRELTAYLQNTNYQGKDIQEEINNFVNLRRQFFQENPYYSNIFFGTLLQPPNHLLKEIQNLRRNFDELNVQNYRRLIEQLELREGITADMALNYFIIFQDMFNGYFQSKTEENTDIMTLAEIHELKLSDIMNILLYGLAKQNPHMK